MQVKFIQMIQNTPLWCLTRGLLWLVLFQSVVLSDLCFAFYLPHLLFQINNISDKESQEGMHFVDYFIYSAQTNLALNLLY